MHIRVRACGILKVELVKEAPDVWPELGHYPKKEEAKQHRQRAEDEFRVAYVKELETRKTNKDVRNRESTNLCIKKDERKRENIDNIKNTIVSSLGEKNPTNLEPEPDNDSDIDNDSKCMNDSFDNEDGEREIKINKAVKKSKAKYSIELAKKIAVEDKQFVEKDKSYVMPNLMEQAKMFDWAGINFGDDTVYLIQKSLKKLALTSSASPIRFFGKIYGT